MSETYNDGKSDSIIYTSEDLKEALTALAEKIVSNQSSMHSMLLLDHLLRLPNASQLFTPDLMEQARDLWKKIESTGLQIAQPPFLFGPPVTLS
jgi:hypothetical protein